MLLCFYFMGFEYILRRLTVDQYFFKNDLIFFFLNDTSVAISDCTRTQRINQNIHKYININKNKNIRFEYSCNIVTL